MAVVGNSPSAPSGKALREATPSVYVYFGLMTLFFIMPGNIAFAPLQFLYKNQLHLDAHQTAIFKLIVNAPGYVGFLFGFIRDRVSVPKMGDRGLILISALGCSLIYLAMTEFPLTIVSLGVGLILTALCGGLLGAAFNALIRNVADARMMSGRISTLFNLVNSAVPAVFVFAGGWLIDHTSWRVQLSVVAGAYAALASCGFWKPKSALQGVPIGGGNSLSSLWKGFRMLLKNRGYWVAVAMSVLWAFTPAGITPMQFFLTNTLKMNGAQYGIYNSIWAIAVIPPTLLFGLLCKHLSLWRLLLLSTFLAVPQWAPVMFVHTIQGAYLFSAFGGAMGAMATVAYWGLLIRACPKDLAGAGMLLAPSLALVAIELGNILGGYIFDSWGFKGCAVVTTVAYAFLLPLCFMIPRALVSPKDDERVPNEEELISA